MFFFEQFMQVDSKEWVTIEGKPVFIGGPSSGGGSAATYNVGGINYSQETIDNALQFVKGLVTSSRDIDTELSPEAKDFLSHTVTKDNYVAYRGIGLINPRVSYDDAKVINTLKPGDSAPSFLAKHGNPYESWSTKKSEATHYAEGRMSIVLTANIPRRQILVDTSNLQKILSGINQSIIEENDFDYFRMSKEILTTQFPQSTILSIKGRISGTENPTIV